MIANYTATNIKLQYYGRLYYCHYLKLAVKDREKNFTYELVFPFPNTRHVEGTYHFFL